jgi:hypothetical protein
MYFASMQYDTGGDLPFMIIFELTFELLLVIFRKNNSAIEVQYTWRAKSLPSSLVLQAKSLKIG